VTLSLRDAIATMLAEFDGHQIVVPLLKNTPETAGALERAFARLGHEPAPAMPVKTVVEPLNK
jgi:hypothetical protein